MATNLHVFTSTYGIKKRFAACKCWKQSR